MYDVRGRAGTQVSDELALAVGRAVGTRIRRAGGRTAAVGRDVRHSSPGLAAAVARGFAECGLRVEDLGQVPTPVLYHALFRRGSGGGIMVTGSHNPKSDNGLKICVGTVPLWGEGIRSLRDQIEAGDFVSGDGPVERVDWVPSYLDEVCASFRFERPFRVAIDCGNGVMGPVVLEAFRRLGVEAVPLYCEPDGDFPNHIPDPEVPRYMEALGRAVVEREAACGLGFDGDGDRVGVLDEAGRKISADWLVALFAREVLREHPGGTVRYDVKCSDFLEDDIRAHGGVPVMGPTGHSLLKRDIAELDAVLGGELSGHIIFNRGFLPIDDSLYCALYFLGLLDRSGGAASGLFARFPALQSTAEIKVPCPDDAKFEVVAALAERFRREHRVVDIDGARVSLDDGAWFLVRASNTTPVLTVRLEARTREALLAARDLLAQALAEHPQVESGVLRDEVPDA
jgi:phosphomannomutase/phosphoglucomutase